MALESKCPPRERVYNERTEEWGWYVRSIRPRIDIQPDGGIGNRTLPKQFEVVVDVIRGEKFVREVWPTSDGLVVYPIDA